MNSMDWATTYWERKTYQGARIAGCKRALSILNNAFTAAKYPRAWREIMGAKDYVMCQMVEMLNKEVPEIDLGQWRLK